MGLQGKEAAQRHVSARQPAALRARLPVYLSQHMAPGLKNREEGKEVKAAQLLEGEMIATLL